MKYFPPFQFDERSGLLSRAGEDVPLTRKAAELLQALVAQPGVVVSHQDLAQRIWPTTHVQPENLKTLVHELRSALGDHPQTPRYIRSESGRGYVFVAQVTDAMVPLLDDAGTATPAFVRRLHELSILDRHLTRAVRFGEPQLVIVEGERGFGKTSLCEAFVRQAIRHTGLRVSYAQGLEAQGAVEDYGVLIDAIDLLGRQYPALVPHVLADRAPEWERWQSRYASGRSDADSRAGRVPGSEPMARELGAALDDLASETPLLLVLEDLQWADSLSVECLRIISRRRARSRLCILLTYCDADPPTVRALKRMERDLDGSERGSAIVLRPLTEAELLDQLGQRLGVVAQRIHGAIYRAVGGNPSLAAKTVDRLIHLGALFESSSGWRVTRLDRLERALGAALGDALNDQIDRLSSSDRAMLEAAAATGPEFAASQLMASLGSTETQTSAIEQRLRHLAARHVLVDQADGPDTRDGSPWFRFRHEQIPRLLVDRAPLERRLRLPRRHEASTPSR